MRARGRCMGCLLAAIGCALLLACSSAAGFDDLLREKEHGVARSYPVNPEQASQLSRDALADLGAAAVQENETAGYLLARVPRGAGSLVAVWIRPAGCGSLITVRTRGQAFIGERVGEESVHQRLESGLMALAAREADAAFAAQPLWAY